MLSYYKVATDIVDRARVTPAVGMALADEILGERSGVTDAPNAVLGRWNGTKYVCEPMSVDHTGFNPDEVSRLQREHPGEHGIVDPRSGRVHGLATSRAFGDS